MPEIFRFYGFTFFFFSREHEPIHVHVEGNGGRAKYVWDGEVFILTEKRNIKHSDLKRINAVVQDNSDLIIKHWKTYFEK